MVDISLLPSLGKCYATSFWSPWILMRNLSPLALISSCCFSLADFQMISLSLGFRSLIMIYLGLSYLRFAQPWISRFMSFPKFGKFLTIIYLNTLSASCSPFGLFSFFLDFNDGNIGYFSYSSAGPWGSVNFFTFFFSCKLSEFYHVISNSLVLLCSIFWLSPLINFGYCIFQIYNSHLIFKICFLYWYFIFHLFQENM